MKLPIKFPIELIYTWYRQTIRHPKYRWWVVLATIAYLVNPFDVSPDMLPFLGQIDDAMVVTLLATELSQILVEQVKKRPDRRTDDPQDVVTVDV